MYISHIRVIMGMLQNDFEWIRFNGLFNVNIWFFCRCLFIIINIHFFKYFIAKTFNRTLILLNIYLDTVTGYLALLSIIIYKEL